MNILSLPHDFPSTSHWIPLFMVQKMLDQQFGTYGPWKFSHPIFHPMMYDILWFARIIPFFIHIFIHPLFPTTELRHASELKLKDWRKTLRVFSDAAMSKFQKVGHGLVEASWDIAKKRPSGKHTTSYWKWDLRGIYGNLWCFTLWQTFTSLQAIENHHFIVGKWTRNDHFQ